MPEKVSIRGIDPELYKQARHAAIDANKTIGAWLNEAIWEAMKRRGRSLQGEKEEIRKAFRFPQRSEKG